MSVFLDTSALLAILDADHRVHAKSRKVRADLIGRGETIVPTSYVPAETFALAQHRLGIETVRCLAEDILPIVRIHWVGEVEHRAGVTALLRAGRRELSLVDCASFLVMRQLNLKKAFAFDRDFVAQGFETLH